jgi:hypothetical protein
MSLWMILVKSLSRWRHALDSPVDDGDHGALATSGESGELLRRHDARGDLPMPLGDKRFRDDSQFRALPGIVRRQS